MESLKIIFCFIIISPLYGQFIVETNNFKMVVFEVDNSFFSKDKIWLGADGAASIDLGNGKILWLFSDTFIDTQGTGKRINSKMINNSIAIQEGYTLDNAKLSFYYGGKQKDPKSFFELPGETWLWTGHGSLIGDKLIIFLFEEKRTETGIGFEAIGWHIALIDNPFDSPLNWNINYIKGTETFGVIIGTSSVLKDADFIYTYGVKEPSSHEVYLLRLPINKIIEGDISELAWWVEGNWVIREKQYPVPSHLFIGQTEFSVHFQEDIQQYVQIQTYGWGDASLGYRLAQRPEGPWTDPVIFYKPHLYNKGDFVYSANAHPEITADGILVTYNVNNGDFNELIQNENIYFPKLIRIKFIK